MLIYEKHFRGKHSEWSVWCYVVLYPSSWISGVLNDVFVSGLPALASLPVHLQWSRSLQYVHASVCWSHVFGHASWFPNLCYYHTHFSLLQFVFKNSTSILWRLLIKSLPPLLSDILQYPYIIILLKIMICNNIVWICLQPLEMYPKPSIIWFTHKICFKKLRIYRVDQKTGPVWALITQRWLVVERRVIRQKFQNTAKNKRQICIVKHLNILCLICINIRHSRNSAKFNCKIWI